MNGPKHGAATIPRVRPIKKVPKYPPKLFEATRVRPEGILSSHRPKKLRAREISIPATTMSTIGF